MLPGRYLSIPRGMSQRLRELYMHIQRRISVSRNTMALSSIYRLSRIYNRSDVIFELFKLEKKLIRTEKASFIHQMPQSLFIVRKQQRFLYDMDCRKNVLFVLLVWQLVTEHSERNVLFSIYHQQVQPSRAGMLVWYTKICTKCVQNWREFLHFQGWISPISAIFFVVALVHLSFK